MQSVQQASTQPRRQSAHEQLGMKMFDFGIMVTVSLICTFFIAVNLGAVHGFCFNHIPHAVLAGLIVTLIGLLIDIRQSR
ncbi:hypothetical protein ACFL1U_02210 [Patescibacteria group bacterium]